MSVKPKILLVEDDEAMRAYVGEELSSAGYAVVPAVDATAAMKLVSEGRRDDAGFDVVVTDVRLGREDGIDLLSDLREKFRRSGDPEPGMVVVSGFGTVETAIRAFRSGAADFLPKPFEMQALLLSIERVLEQRRLRGEIRRLRREIDGKAKRPLVAVSPPMRAVMELVDRVADSDATLLVTGPSGTGKEVLARALHERSARASGPFVAINCAAMPEALLESELFGHRRGAFTDARVDRDGLFRSADGGTLLLDEVGELPLELQPKLLRVLQEREIRPIGANRSEPVDVRVVAASNRRLEELVAAGRFREDLYYRINVIQLELAPLARRAEDVLPLAEAFLDRAARKGRPRPVLSAASRHALLQYRWPGNVRELENAVERAVALCRGDVIEPADLPPAVTQPAPVVLVESAVARRLTLEQLSNEYCVAVVQQHGGNQSAAARVLDIDRKTLARRLAAGDAVPSTQPHPPE